MVLRIYIYILLSLGLLFVRPLAADSELELLSEWPQNFETDAWDVAISGDHAYVIFRSGTLGVYDISDLSNPVRISTLDIPTAWSIEIYNGYAFVESSNSGILIIDITNPYRPRRDRTIEVAYILDMKIHGDYLYILNNNSYVTVYDIKKPWFPIQVISFGVGTNPYEIFIYNNNLYVARWDYGIDIYNISNPLQVEYKSTIFSEYYIRNIKQYNQTLVIRNGDDEINFYDMQIETEPVLIDRVNINEWINNIFLHGNLLYIISDYLTLNIYNLDDLNLEVGPVIINNSNFNYSVVKVINNLIFTIDSSGIVLNIILNAGVIEEQCVLAKNQYNKDFAFADEIGCLIDEDDGVSLIDYSNPEFPYLIGKFFQEYSFYKVTIFERYIYLITDDYRIVIVDISNVYAPAILSIYEVSTDIHHFEITNNRIYYSSYVNDEGGYYAIHVVDIQNKYNPVLISRCKVDHSVWGIEASGDYAYASLNENGLLVVDFSNLDSPSVVKRIVTPSYSLEISGSKLYSKNRYEINVYDIVNPSKIELFEYIELWYNGTSFRLLGNYLYVPYSSYLYVYEMNQWGYNYVESYDTGSYINDIEINGDYIFVEKFGNKSQILWYKKGDYYTSTINTTAYVPAAGGYYEVFLNSNAYWNIYEDYFTPRVDVYPREGFGSSVLSITVPPNTWGEPIERMLYIGNTKHTIIQEGAEPYVEITPEFSVIGYDGGYIGLYVEGNYQWTVSEDLEWVSIVYSESFSEYVTLFVDPNTSINPREAQITIGNGSHTIYQEGAPAYYFFEKTDSLVGASGGVIENRIFSNTEWQVNYSPDWVTLSPTSGSGDSPLELIVEPNLNMSDRIDTISIGFAQWLVWQSGAGPRVEISPSEKEISSEGGGYSLTVSSNTDWAVSNLPDWVVANPTNSSMNGAVQMTVEPNPFARERSASISVGSETHIVTQLPSEATYMLDISSTTVPATASVFTVTIQSNADWSVIDLPEWVTATPSSGQNSGSLVFSVSANPQTNSRNTVIKIGDKSVEITQAAAAPITTISPSTFNTGPEQKTYTIDVESNTNWDVTSQQTWLSFSPESGFGNGQIQVTVEAFPKVGSRLALLDIGGQTHELSQFGVPIYINVSPTEVTLSGEGGQFDIEIRTNVDWTLEFHPEWIIPSHVSGNGDSTLSFTYAANSTLSEREGAFRITGNAVTLVQGAGTDKDEDGYFDNLSVGHSLHDPNDSNKYIPFKDTNGNFVPDNYGNDLTEPLDDHSPLLNISMDGTEIKAAVRLTPGCSYTLWQSTDGVNWTQIGFRLDGKLETTLQVDSPQTLSGIVLVAPQGSMLYMLKAHIQ